MEAKKTQAASDLSVLFDYVDRRGRDAEGFKPSIRALYERNARRSGLVVRAIVHVLSVFLRPCRHSTRYFFWGTKFEEIILGLPRQEVCVMGGPITLLYCMRRHLRYVPCLKFWKGLSDALAGDPARLFDRIENELTAFSKVLSNYAHNEAVLIVDNDSMPLQRAVILAARRGGVSKSICIQDGLFQAKTQQHVTHGWFADLFFAINEHQKNLLVNEGMSPEKIRLMGFHSTAYIPARPLSMPGERRICFIGQPWMKYCAEQGMRYLEIVSSVERALTKYGYKMSYKPHPWERGESYLSMMPQVLSESLSSVIENYDVMISLTSTALYEVQASGRISIQILDDAFEQDDFSVHGNVIVLKMTGGDGFSERLLTAVNAAEQGWDQQLPAVERFVKACCV